MYDIVCMCERMCMISYIHVCVLCIYIQYACMHVLYVGVQLCMNAYMNVYMYMCVYAYMYACMHACPYVGLHAYICMYKGIYIYIYVHISNKYVGLLVSTYQ